MNRQIIPFFLISGLSFLFFSSSAVLQEKFSIKEKIEKKTIYEIAEEQTGAPAWILEGIAMAESGGINLAIGDGGKSKGLMQLNESYRKERVQKYGEYDPFDPLESLIISGKLYIDNLKLLGSEDLAIAAHRQGVSGVRKYGPSYWYIKKVKNILNL